MRVCVTSCRGAKMSSNTSFRVSALIFPRCWSGLEDVEYLGGMGNKGRNRTAIEQGLLRRANGRFPIII